MSRRISEVVVCGIFGEFTDESLRLYLETLSSSPERSNTVFRQAGDYQEKISDINLYYAKYSLTGE